MGFCGGSNDENDYEIGVREERARIGDEVAALRVENGAMATWLGMVVGAAFFGPTAPDESSMQFTITVTAAEWRTMRALVDASEHVASANKKSGA